MELRFTVPGRPVPKERPRKGRWRWYTPTRTVEYEQKVAMYALIARGEFEQRNGKRWPLDGKYRVQSIGHYSNRAHLPDEDNVLKAVKDALQHVLWENDRQVYRSTSETRIEPNSDYLEVWAWSSSDSSPGTPPLRSG